MQRKVFYFDSPTTLGALALTGFGFAPKLLLVFSANHGVGGADQDDHHKVMGACTALAQHAWSIEPIHNTSNSRCAAAHSNTKCIYIVDTGGSLILSAERVSMDADGVTLNFLDVWSTPIRLYCVALGGDELEVAIGDGTARTSLGTQDINVGFVPDAFICHTGTSSASMPLTSSNFSLSGGIGFGTSPDDQYFSGWRHDSGITTPRSATYQESGVILSYPWISGQEPFREAKWVANLAAGVQLEWIRVNATATKYFWIALKGVTARVGTFIVAPVGAEQEITLSGVVPELVFLQSGNKAPIAGSQVHFRTSWGVGDGTSVWSIWGGSKDSGGAVENLHCTTRADADRAFRLAEESGTLVAPSQTTKAAIDTLALTPGKITAHYDVQTAVGQEVQYLVLGSEAAVGSGGGDLLLLGVGS